MNKHLSAIIASISIFPMMGNARAADFHRRAQPNIVYILADDMGSKELHTPNLDKLAREGTILSAFYVQPVCSPTRSTLMTGRYVMRTGVYSVVRPHAT
jgi:arylsulfatase A-like enzyme